MLFQRIYFFPLIKFNTGLFLFLPLIAKRALCLNSPFPFLCGENMHFSYRVYISKKWLSNSFLRSLLTIYRTSIAMIDCSSFLVRVLKFRKTNLKFTFFKLQRIMDTILFETIRKLFPGSVQSSPITCVCITHFFLIIVLNSRNITQITISIYQYLSSL